MAQEIAISDVIWVRGRTVVFCINNRSDGGLGFAMPEPDFDTAN